MRFFNLLSLLIVVWLFHDSATAQSNVNNKKELLYIGSFSENGSEGIYVFDFDRQANSYDLLQTAVSKESPSFLAISPNGRFLVSANREGLESKEEWGSVSLFSIDQFTGKLTHLDDQYSFGDSPCHISFHPSGNFIIVSHYQGGSFAVFPIHPDGSIGDPSANVQLEGKGSLMPRQAQPHTHSAVPSIDGKYLYVSDLGLDKILIYAFDVTLGSVAPASQAFVKTNPGTGPRHFTFSPNGKLAFSAEEISSTIASYKVDRKTGSLELVQQASSLPSSFEGSNSTADIHTTQNGKFVYISNRGFDGLAIFKVLKTGKLLNVDFASTIGRKPRNFLPDPMGEYMFVANRDSNSINIFKLRKDGTLYYTDIQLDVPAPVCIKYLEIK